MNIHEEIAKSIRENHQWEYEKIFLISEFLNDNDFEQRIDKAIQVIKGLMSMHEKGEGPLPECIIGLANIEDAIKPLYPGHRDHVVHALMCYILGIYLDLEFYNFNLNPFQWRLACLFHDIGYPIQIANKVVIKYFEQIENVKNFQRTNRSLLNCSYNFDVLNKLHGDKNSSILIQERINAWGLNGIDVTATCEQHYGCHGIISALTVLNVVDSMYQTHNPTRERGGNGRWDQKYFEDDVVTACSAIFLHSLHEDNFELAKIKPHPDSQIAFMLKLTDSLQDWERPFHKNEGILVEHYNIEFCGQEIIYSAPSGKLEKIKAEIDACLSDHRITFEPS